ncbi:MAG: hypothetical protein AAGF66_03595, partial [Cyanobacteria bacterium P01_H01_bin.119]
MTVAFSALVAFGLPVFCCGIVMHFFIYGYRKTPSAWSFAFLVSALVSFIAVAVVLSNFITVDNLRNKVRIVAGSVALAVGLGFLTGWRLGIPNALELYETESLYAGWIEPKVTVYGAIFGAVAGFLLGKSMASISK